MEQNAGLCHKVSFGYKRPQCTYSNCGQSGIDRNLMTIIGHERLVFCALSFTLLPLHPHHRHRFSSLQPLPSSS